jgi:hypothetical protein
VTHELLLAQLTIAVLVNIEGTGDAVLAIRLLSWATSVCVCFACAFAWYLFKTYRIVATMAASMAFSCMQGVIIWCTIESGTALILNILCILCAVMMRGARISIGC